jgi:aromatic ring-opening dioxygenase catalytic subunit (LigB family)
MRYYASHPYRRRKLMGQIVAGFGVPHTPMFPAQVKRDGPDCETAQLYRTVQEHLDAVKPDVLVVFDSDHLNTFFYNNLPTFSVGVAPETIGPNDFNTDVPRTSVQVNEALGHHLREFGLSHDFDLASTEEFEVDHSIMVPLYFLTPEYQYPIVPLWVNGVAPPIPSAKRCHAVGQMVRQAVESWSDSTRVAVLASGSFSLEVSGPKSGITDVEWMDTVLHTLGQAQHQELMEQATTERMLQAGNVSGELLNWIAMLGAVGTQKPQFLEPQMANGHAYGVWRFD